MQLTGLILTKLDGTARGGAVVSVLRWQAGMPAAQTGVECADGFPCFPTWEASLMGFPWPVAERKSA